LSDWQTALTKKYKKTQAILSKNTKYFQRYYFSYFLVFLERTEQFFPVTISHFYVEARVYMHKHVTTLSLSKPKERRQILSFKGIFALDEYCFESL
jgi:hypothetical protein